MDHHWESSHLKLNGKLNGLQTLHGCELCRASISRCYFTSFSILYLCEGRSSFRAWTRGCTSNRIVPGPWVHNTFFCSWHHGVRYFWRNYIYICFSFVVGLCFKNEKTFDLPPILSPLQGYCLLLCINE